MLELAFLWFTQKAAKLIEAFYNHYKLLAEPQGQMCFYNLQESCDLHD